MRNFILMLSFFSLVACEEKKTTPAAQDAQKADAAYSTPVQTSVLQTPTDREPQKPTGPVTSLALSSPHHDFGDIKKGEKVSHTFTVTNTGKQPLVISKVVPGCGCTAPEFTQDPILPGKEGKITLEFDSSNFEGMVNKEAAVYANVEKSPIQLSFSANIKK